LNSDDLTFTQLADPLNITETASLKMSTQRIRSLNSKNDHLQLENQRLREENQAAKGREEEYRKELEIIKRGFADRRRRDEERLERLMQNGEACGLFSIIYCRSDQR
jgi:regulator of replication initiation timing